MTSTTPTPSTGKVRRDVLGGKRGAGHAYQDRGERVRRPDPTKVTTAGTTERLTSAAGLVAFGQFLRQQGIDRELHSSFDGLKTGHGVVYSMANQMRLMLDAHVAGESRVFGIEALASDPVFVRLAGGTVPCVDTLYRDLGRFDENAVRTLEAVMAHWGTDLDALRRLRRAHLDIDTSVLPVHGAHEGALPGYNPRFHGRPSYHPLVARWAELDTCMAALLRPGDTTFGEADAETVRKLVRRGRTALTSKQELVVRMDSAADCAGILQSIVAEDADFVVKARMTRDLRDGIANTTSWTTVDRDADGKPTTQVAEISFARGEWLSRGLRVRVVAVRTTEPRSGKQLFLWDVLEYTVKAYLTTTTDSPLEVMRCYEDRAGVETLIAEWKGGWGLGDVPCWGFEANHAAFLLKLLAHNLFRRFVSTAIPVLAAAKWRVQWLRRGLIRVPGQLVRSGRSWVLRVPALSPLAHLLE